VKKAKGRIIDRTKELNGVGYQLLNVEKSGNQIHKNSISHKELKKRIKEIVLVVGNIAFWAIFVWYFLKDFYAGY